MKTITMGYDEYHQDLKHSERKGFRAGVSAIRRIIREKNKGANNERLWELCLELELDGQDLTELCKELGVIEPQMEECPF